MKLDSSLSDNECMTKFNEIQTIREISKKEQKNICYSALKLLISNVKVISLNVINGITMEDLLDNKEPKSEEDKSEEAKSEEDYSKLRKKCGEVLKTCEKFKTQNNKD